MNYLLKNARIIDPAGPTDMTADIAVVDGIITAVGPNLAAPAGSEVHDLKGKVAAPGFIDMHVHLREPGFEHKETIDTGCRAAAAGGFTAVCCMPNTQPAIDDASVVRSILEKAAAAVRGAVDVYPIAAVTKNREGKVLAPMIELSAAGAVGFSDDGAPVADAEVMRRALEYAGMLNRPVIQHAEETSMTKGGAMSEGFVSTSLGMPAMPPAAEDVVVGRDIRLVASFPARYHVAHISTRGAVEMVRQAKRAGLPVTCEVTPHHFALTDEAVRSFDTNTKMNPPLRTADDVAAMKEGLKDGTIDAIATDHAPHSYDEKEVEYVYAPFGIVGLETAIGLAVTELVVPGVLTLPRLVEKFAVNPRKILGLPDVRIAPGLPANLTIFDPAAEWVVDIQKFRSKSKNSPFHGRALTGRPVGILNHGVLVWS
jgi:dihydroorotase